MSAITENETRVKYRDNEKAKAATKEAFDSMNEKAIAAGETATEPLAVQVFAIHTVGDETPTDDLVSLIQEPAKQAAVINRGLTLYQQQFANRLILADDFAASDAVYDLLAGLEAIGTRKAAPRKGIDELLGEMDADKIASVLAGLPQDKLEAIFAKLA